MTRVILDDAQQVQDNNDGKRDTQKPKDKRHDDLLF